MLVGLLRREISPSQGLYLYRTAQHRQMPTYIYALSGTRIYDPNVRTAQNNTRFRLHGHWDRLVPYLNA